MRGASDNAVDRRYHLSYPYRVTCVISKRVVWFENEREACAEVLSIQKTMNNRQVQFTEFDKGVPRSAAFRVEGPADVVYRALHHFYNLRMNVGDPTLAPLAEYRVAEVDPGPGFELVRLGTVLRPMYEYKDPKTGEWKERGKPSPGVVPVDPTLPHRRPTYEVLERKADQWDALGYGMGMDVEKARDLAAAYDLTWKRGTPPPTYLCPACVQQWEAAHGAPLPPSPRMPKKGEGLAGLQAEYDALETLQDLGGMMVGEPEVFVEYPDEMMNAIPRAMEAVEADMKKRAQELRWYSEHVVTNPETALKQAELKAYEEWLEKKKE